MTTKSPETAAVTPPETETVKRPWVKPALQELDHEMTESGESGNGADSGAYSGPT